MVPQPPLHTPASLRFRASPKSIGSGVGRVPCCRVTGQWNAGGYTGHYTQVQVGRCTGMAGGVHVYKTSSIRVCTYSKVCHTHFEIAKLKLILRKRHVDLICPILTISFNLVAVELASGLVSHPL